MIDKLEDDIFEKLREQHLQMREIKIRMEAQENAPMGDWEFEVQNHTCQVCGNKHPLKEYTITRTNGYKSEEHEMLICEECAPNDQRAEEIIKTLASFKDL